MTGPGVLLLAFLCILAVAVPAFLLGRAVLGRFRFDGDAESIALSTTLGLGLLSHALFALGLLHLLRTWTILALLAVVSAGSVIGLRRGRTPPAGEPVPRGRRGPVRAASGRWTPRRAGVLLLGAAFAAALVPYLLIPLYPPTAFDATSFHLAAAKEFARQGAVVVVPNLRYPVYTFGAHVLHAALLSLGSDLAPALLSTLASALVVLLLVAWGRSVEGSRTGFAAGLLWLSSPLVLYVSTVAYLDAMLTLFVTVAVYCFWRWHRDGSLSSLALAGALAGFACSMKYTALFALAALGALLLVLAARRPKAGLLVVVFSACALAAGAPWYVRNAWLTGNPTWPFLTGLFGTGPYWSARDLAGVWKDLETPGMGHDLKALVLLPWNLLVHGRSFYIQGSGELSRAVPLALPFVALGGATLASGWIVVVLLASLVSSWFFGSQVLRYLLPAIPIYCFLAAVGVTRLVKWPVLSRRPRALAAAGLALAGAILLPASRTGWSQLRRWGPPPLSSTDRDRFLERRLPEYPALRAVPAGGGAVYSLFGANLAYYSPSRFVGDWFGPWPYRTVQAALRSGGESLHALLTTWNCEYFHVARNLMYSQAKAALPDDEDFRRLFQLVYASDQGELYRLRKSGLQPSPEVQLLENPGFERRNAEGHESGWAVFGSPRFDSTGLESRSGRVAALVDQKNTIFQPVTVEPGKLYRLRMFARAASGPGALVRLQVNWIDSGGKPAGLYLRPVTLADGWLELTAICRAPGGARRAVVYGVCHGRCGAGVWIDDLTLSEILEALPASTP